MKKIVYLFLILAFAEMLLARLLFVGPDPYFSYRTFPQDALLFKNRMVVFFSLQKRGWMGNLDDPEASPSPTYISTKEEVSQDLNGQVYTAGFEGSWKAPYFTALAYGFEFSSLRVIPIISARWDVFSLKASGTAIGEEDGEKFPIPFSSQLSQTNMQSSLGAIMVGELGDTPVGMLFSFSRFSEGSPRGYLRYTLEGEERELGVFNWGWSTVHGCNHIFGVSANIDSFWQDFYAQTSYSQLDMVIGADLGDNRIGFRFRRISGLQDYYEYQEEENRFLKKKWGNTIGRTTFRNYGVFKLKEFSPGVKLFVVTFLEASFARNHDRWMGETLLDGYRENDYEAELLPFIHFDLPGKGFLRIGTSLSITQGNFKQVEIWGGREVYAGGWVYYGWEEQWERPSYGSFWRIIVFSEADLEIPLSSALRLIFNLWSHHNFLYTRKIYGSTRSDGDGLYFKEKARRNSFLKEFWLSGSLGFMTQGPISLGIFADFPIHYDNYMRTEVKGEKYFSAIADPQPKIRKPFSLWAVISFGLW